MVRYANGEVPLSELVKVGDTYLFPGTAKRWAAFVAAVKKETGVTLRITPKQNGASNGYRSRLEQAAIRKVLGVMAAVEGTSSHGGWWTGQTKGHSGIPTWVSDLETGAIDVENYWEIPWATFKRLANKYGFIVDITVPEELWHIVDPDPWGRNLKEIPMSMSSEDVKRIAAEVVRQISVAHIGNMIKAIYAAVRFGKKGVRTHGDLTAALMSEIGAQQIYRATHGQAEKIDVTALAAAISDELDPVDAEKLANAILKAQGKALTDATRS